MQKIHGNIFITHKLDKYEYRLVTVSPADPLECRYSSFARGWCYYVCNLTPYHTIQANTPSITLVPSISIRLRFFGDLALNKIINNYEACYW